MFGTFGETSYSILLFSFLNNLKLKLVLGLLAFPVASKNIFLWKTELLPLLRFAHLTVPPTTPLPYRHGHTLQQDLSPEEFKHILA